MYTFHTVQICENVLKSLLFKIQFKFNLGLAGSTISGCRSLEQHLIKKYLKAPHDYKSGDWTCHIPCSGMSRSDIFSSQGHRNIKGDHNDLVVCQLLSIGTVQ
jgi:hypothetical protein